MKDQPTIKSKTFLDYPSVLHQLNLWKENGYDPFNFCQIVYVPAKASHMYDKWEVFYDSKMD